MRYTAARFRANSGVLGRFFKAHVSRHTAGITNYSEVFVVLPVGRRVLLMTRKGASRAGSSSPAVHHRHVATEEKRSVLEPDWRRGWGGVGDKCTHRIRSNTGTHQERRTRFLDSDKMAVKIVRGASNNGGAGRTSRAVPKVSDRSTGCYGESLKGNKALNWVKLLYVLRFSLPLPCRIPF